MISRSWERQRLNERPIYLRSLYLGLALLQTAGHLWFDYDKIGGFVDSVHHGSPSGERPQATSTPIEQLRSKLPAMLQEVGITSSVFALVGPIIYSLTVRKTAWRTSLACARFLRWDIPGTAELSLIPPYHLTLITRSLVSGFCLLLLWHASNLAFSVYVAQEPVKRGQPLTQDSNDPNGSLINGLTSRKSLVKVSLHMHYDDVSDLVGRHLHSGSWHILARVSQPAVSPSSRILIVQEGRRGLRYLLNASR